MRESSQRSRRFYRSLWRFNAVCISLAGAGILLAGAFGLAAALLSAIPSGSKEATIAPEKADGATWKLGSFETMPQLGCLYAPVYSEQKWNGKWRHKEASATCNYFFISTDKHATRFLLPDNRSIVIDLRPLRTPGKEKAQWVYARVVRKDTSGDNLLSEAADAFSIGFANPDGSGFKEVLTGINEVLGETRRGATGMVVVYRQGKTMRLAELNIPKRVVVTQRELPAMDQKPL